MATPDNVAQALAAIRTANPSLKAFTAVRDDASASSMARQLTGPLAGKLIAVKDIFDTADFPTAYGSPIYSGHQPSTEAAMVGIIRNAGGLVIGKSVTTEFAYLEPACTLNPAAPGCTPGGSSAGSAAAVAAGLVPLSVGSQTGGSTIRPASYCGIAGFKPSFGVLPTAGMKCFAWSLDTVGLFARTVAEVSEFARAASGQRIMPPASREPGEWTIGVPDAYPWGEISASAQRAMARATEVLRAAGARLVPCTLPSWAAEAFTAHDTVQGWEAARALALETDTGLDRLSPLLREYLLASAKITDEAYAAAQAVAREARLRCREWLAGVDVLLTPSAPDEPPMGNASTGASTFNRAWTLLGTPCLNVPGAVGVNNRPMGVQFIAPPGNDSDCLAAGLLLEHLLRA
ncbi:amidase [Caenimonas soli]|uniref:amidase n=1 Tax=Caenimonas soli TaxID=2735555 RepID=UPI001556A6DD|nr:amidase [Caenimonas soli]NPC57244.1 amidase [Caenimonas soli]